MWKAEVTSSQVSPGLGSSVSLVSRAFSSVLREPPSSMMRAGSMPSAVKKRAPAWASESPSGNIMPEPPETSILASG